MTGSPSTSTFSKSGPRRLGSTVGTTPCRARTSTESPAAAPRSTRGTSGGSKTISISRLWPRRRSSSRGGTISPPSARTPRGRSRLSSWPRRAKWSTGRTKSTTASRRPTSSGRWCGAWPAHSSRSAGESRCRGRRDASAAEIRRAGEGDRTSVGAVPGKGRVLTRRRPPRNRANRTQENPMNYRSFSEDSPAAAMAR
jgi:hypothetical protein